MDSKDAIEFAQKLIDQVFVSTKYIQIPAMLRDIVSLLVNYGSNLIDGEYREALFKLEAILFLNENDYSGYLSNSLYEMLDKEFLPSCSECKDILRGGYATCSKCKATCCIKLCSVELKRQLPKRSFKIQLKTPSKDDTKGSITCCNKCYEKILDSIKI